MPTQMCALPGQHCLKSAVQFLFLHSDIHPLLGFELFGTHNGKGMSRGELWEKKIKQPCL